MDEKTLVQQAQAGDFGAFSQLIQKHQDAIYALARRLSGNIEDAEDIVQDTLLKAIDKIDQFRIESSFGTWLYAIALNQARAMFAKRKQGELKPIEEYLPSGNFHGGNAEEHHRLFDWGHPERLLETEELRQIIDRLISELPFKYREAFVLRYLEEMSVKEVAKAINESEAATKSRILRARLALREGLSAIFGEHHGKQLS